MAPKSARARGLARQASSSRFGVVPERVRQESSRDLLDADGNVANGPCRPPDAVLEGWRMLSFLTRMAGRLASWVGLSWWAWVMFCRLLLFAGILLPAFLRMVWRYFRSDKIFREFYGPVRRQSVDIYLDAEVAPPDGALRPVIVFFSGGAWIIGYKAWGAFLGFCYSRAGYLVCVPDYRNFPQGAVEDMLDDVDLALDWCVANVRALGGDPEAIVLMGQSAGAHLSSTALLRGLAREQSLTSAAPRDLQNPYKPVWTPARNLGGFIGVSGPYNLVTLCPHLSTRGLNISLLRMIFRNDFEMHSPSYLARRLVEEHGGPLPCAVPVALIHGTADKTCPSEQSEELYSVLRECLAPEDPDKHTVSLSLLEGLTHTDPIIELPMKGRDPLMECTAEHLRKMTRSRPLEPMTERMLPDFVVDAARLVNPF